MLAGDQYTETEAYKAALAATAAKEMERILSELLSDELYEQAVARLGDAMTTAIDAQNPAFFTRPVSPLATARARRLAKEAATSLARQLSEAQLRSMGETIAQGLIEGKRPRDLYRSLEEVKALDANRAKRYEKIRDALENSDLSDAALKRRLDREYTRLLNERKKMIAQTEGRKATSEARNLEAKERNAIGKFWITAQDERLCPICAGNERDKVIAVDDTFSGGTATTPAHPNCRCSIGYVYTPKQEKYFDKRQQERIAETEAAQAEAQKDKG